MLLLLKDTKCNILKLSDGSLMDLIKNSTFWGFYVWLLIGVKGQEKIAYPLKRLAVQGDFITLTY